MIKYPPSVSLNQDEIQDLITLSIELNFHFFRNYIIICLHKNASNTTQTLVLSNTHSPKPFLATRSNHKHPRSLTKLPALQNSSPLLLPFPFTDSNTCYYYAPWGSLALPSYVIMHSRARIEMCILACISVL